MRRCFGHHRGFQRSRLPCIGLFVLQGRLCKPLPVFFTVFQVSKDMFERFDIDFVSRFPHVHDPDGFNGANCSCPSSWRLRLERLWCRLTMSFTSL